MKQKLCSGCFFLDWIDFRVHSNLYPDPLEASFPNSANNKKMKTTFTLSSFLWCTYGICVQSVTTYFMAFEQPLDKIRFTRSVTILHKTGKIKPKIDILILQTQLCALLHVLPTTPYTTYFLKHPGWSSPWTVTFLSPFRWTLVTFLFCL